MIKVSMSANSKFPILIRLGRELDILTLKQARNLRNKLDKILDVPVEQLLKDELRKMRENKAYARKCAKESGIWTKNGKLKKQFNR
jgi:hypothetical protein